MTPLKRRAWIAAPCLAIILVGSACGGSSSKSKKSSQPATSTSTAPKANATESAPPGDIPDNQAFVAYAAPNGAFSVQIPEGWAMTRAGQVVLFTDKYNSIRIESHPAASRPSRTSARASDVPAIRAATPGFVPGDVKTVQRKSGPAVLLTYRADSPPNEVTGKVAVESVERYEFWRGGTEVVLTLSAPVGSDNVDPWRKVTDAFTWTA
jgi:hypothetical protein